MAKGHREDAVWQHQAGGKDAMWSAKWVGGKDALWRREWQRGGEEQRAREEREATEKGESEWVQWQSVKIKGYHVG